MLRIFYLLQFGLVTVLLTSCAAYAPPPGVPTAVLAIQMPDLKENKGYVDDSGVIQIMDNSDGKDDSRLGFVRVLAAEKKGDFKIPAGRKIRLLAGTNLALVAASGSCIVDIALEPKVDGRYRLLLRHSRAAGLCTAELYEALSVGANEIQLGAFSSELREGSIRAKVVRIP